MITSSRLLASGGSLSSPVVGASLDEDEGGCRDALPREVLGPTVLSPLTKTGDTEPFVSSADRRLSSLGILVDMMGTSLHFQADSV